MIPHFIDHFFYAQMKDVSIFLFFNADAIAINGMGLCMSPVFLLCKYFTF